MATRRHRAGRLAMPAAWWPVYREWADRYPALAGSAAEAAFAEGVRRALDAVRDEYRNPTAARAVLDGVACGATDLERAESAAYEVLRHAVQRVRTKGPATDATDEDGDEWDAETRLHNLQTEYDEYRRRVQEQQAAVRVVNVVLADGSIVQCAPRAEASDR